MAEFKHYKAIDNKGKNLEVTIASGPVIIKDGRVLLDKHDDPFWKFPGGKVIDNNSFQERGFVVLALTSRSFFLPLLKIHGTHRL